MILAGDIGGTKTNLALFEVVEGALQMRESHQFASSKYETFSEVIAEFLSLTQEIVIDALCLGIAGPIINGNCRTTNLPWEINSQDLREMLKVEDVYLLNDLEATAYGMLYLGESDFMELNSTAKEKDGNRAVIAAGTGLGEAMLFYDGTSYHPIGSEGGHTDFAPLTEQQDELLVWLRQRYPTHVSLERILSGPGIYTLYEFLKMKEFAAEPEMMLNAEKDADKSAIISECALKQNDPLCLETLRLFVEIYGAEAGNLALKSLSVGGVYIGGGIAPKILPFMLDGNFMNAFVKKGRFESLLREMKVKLSLNQETALLGAAHFAKDKVKK
jgi:glucokinase